MLNFGADLRIPAMRDQIPAVVAARPGSWAGLLGGVPGGACQLPLAG